MTNRKGMISREMLITCGISCALLAGVALDWRLFHGAITGTDDYHRVVRTAVEGIPYQVDNWVSEDVPVPPAAIAMLRPNVILSRRYRNLATGLEANLLLVQCLDARDLYGHFPPICYVADGYTMLDAQPTTYQMDSQSVQGKMYTFSSSNLASRKSMKVFDLMALPNGKTAPDMAGVDLVARDRHMRHFGAAQLQIVTDSVMSDDDRRDVIDVLLGVSRKAIDAIQEGVVR